jgi:hypothetical protein
VGPCVAEAPRQPFGAEFDRFFEERAREAEAFYAVRIPQNLKGAAAGLGMNRGTL